jgi:hypothetical protein
MVSSFSDDAVAEKSLALSGAFASRDIGALKRLAGEFCEAALVRNDAPLVRFGVAAYALANVLEKGHLESRDSWTKFANDVQTELVRLNDSLKTGRATEQSLDELLNTVRGVSSRMGRFTINAVDKSALKCAAQLYAHGASLSRAGAMTGADITDIASYVSSTRMPEKYVTLSARQRLESARKVLS